MNLVAKNPDLKNPDPKNIGILSLQGGVSAHKNWVIRGGDNPIEIKTIEHLTNVDGLILPGGESGVQLKLLHRYGLFGSIKEKLSKGFPVLGTCAGAIHLAAKVHSPSQNSFEILDYEIQRNAYGRQIFSFEAQSEKGHDLVFIRAPKFINISNDIKVLDTLKNEVIWVQSKSSLAQMAMSFHPELKDNELRIYQSWVSQF